MRFILGFLTLYSFSVGSTLAQKLLTFDEYMDIVVKNHPVAMQAGLKTEEGKMSVRQARGSFDPKLMGTYREKFYDDKEYYGLLDAGLKVPTWYGIEFEGGYQQNQGDFLNPESNVPTDGLFYGGITVPIGQGLIMDKRRNSLRQAQIYQEITEMERRLMLNELLYQAGSAYWDWFTAYNKVLIFEDALELAEIRLNAVKKSAELGDRPNIDTLEAGIQVQQRTLGLQQSQLEFQNSTIMLSVFLWADGYIPLEPDTNTVPLAQNQLPGDVPLEQRLNYQDSLLANHPEIRKMDLKIDQLNVEQRWKREQLKPNLNLKYNFLTIPANENTPYTLNDQNYVWGLEFAFPILLRKERANVRLNRLKIRDTEFSLTSKRARLLYKVNAAINSWNNTSDQIELFTRTVNDFAGLLDGERRMFNAGESSLFMVNAREIGYIGAQVKLVEILGKNQKARLSMDYALGQLGS